MKKMTKAMIMAFVGYLIIEEPEFCMKMLKAATAILDKKIEKVEKHD